ncbi:MAG: alpha/beta hydrolase [Acidimicrobiales bacterium]
MATLPARTWDSIEGPAGHLAVHVAPAGPLPPGPANTVVLCHDFPPDPASAERTGRSLPVLADRLAAESGWRVVAGCLRGVGTSSSDFSLRGWMADLRALASFAADVAGGGGIWIVGFGVTGALAICLAAADPSIRGVACLGSPATFADWAHDPSAMLAAARHVGVVRSDTFPSDVDAWALEFTQVHPVEAATALAPRPLLVVHGADDDEVPVSDARVLTDAAGSRAELRVLVGAGHRLRADPRAMALLVGWLERQGP